MTVTRYREGTTTITVTGDLEAAIRKAIDRAAAASVRVLEGVAEELAAKARADWYAPGTGVTRRTGRSGDIQVVTTLDAGAGVVRVAIGSTDTRKDKRGRPVAALVRRPGRLSLVKVEVSNQEYFGTPKNLRLDYPFVLRHNPAASDGKTLLPELVIKPGRVALRAALPRLSAAMKGG